MLFKKVCTGDKSKIRPLFLGWALEHIPLPKVGAKDRWDGQGPVGGLKLLAKGDYHPRDGAGGSIHGVTEPTRIIKYMCQW